MSDTIERDERAGSFWGDPWLAGATAILVIFGLVMVVSASSHFSLKVYGSPWSFGLRQLFAVALGLAAGGAVLLLPWRLFLKLPRPAWWASVLLLAAVQSPLGHAAKGAPRWINLGFFNLQPSELAKVALALMMARHLARNEGRIRDVLGTVASGVGGYLVPMLVLVALQRDLGSMALLGGVTGVALFVAGLELRWMFAAFGAAAAGGALMIVFEEFRARRILSFFDPHADAEGGGYQIVQGWVAMAVGGVGGQGLGHGVAQQGFLPEAHTDMIMAVVVEELGILGWATVFVLHGIILWRGTRIAADCRGLYEMIAASCITAVIGAQVVINTGVIGGLVPPKGLVLPFMSYGASAMLANLIEVAILMRIARENQRYAPIEVELSPATLPDVSSPGELLAGLPRRPSRAT
ncbi:MAG TPA: putative peptidoglycan glycosyltransferase FtsW [Myxococcota bacterium]|nr:putative peptidoglycan glycosyltransferase FtsW [Myxococcota bacterium]